MKSPITPNHSRDRAGSRRRGVAWWLTLVLANASLHPLHAQTPEAPGEMAADFLLRDENPNSPRTGRIASPRDYRLQISAYYFGAAG